jgi:heme oxygenase
MDAEVKPGRWKTLCERSFVKAEEATGLLLVAEGSKLTPSCK